MGRIGTLVVVVVAALALSVVGSSSVSASGPAITSMSMDVNHVSLTELDTLPGVGPIIAQRMVDARPMLSCQDMITRVKGIGPIKGGRICPLVAFIVDTHN